MKPVVINFSYGSFDCHHPKELDGRFSKEEFSARITQLNARVRRSKVLAKLKFIPYTIFILTLIISLGVAFAKYREENDERSHYLKQNHFAPPGGSYSKGYQFLYAIISIILSALLGLVIMKLINWGRTKMRTSAINKALQSYNSDDASHGLYWRFVNEKNMQEYNAKHQLDISQMCLVIEMDGLSNSEIEINVHNHTYHKPETDSVGPTNYTHHLSLRFSQPQIFPESGFSRLPLTSPPPTQTDITSSLHDDMVVVQI